MAARKSPFRDDVLRGKVALVTGISVISFKIAVQLARHGAHVAMMGRRREVLDKAVAVLRSHGLPVRSNPNPSSALALPTISTHVSSFFSEKSLGIPT